MNNIEQPPVFGSIFQTRNKKRLGAPMIATRSKDATGGYGLTTRSKKLFSQPTGLSSGATPSTGETRSATGRAPPRQPGLKEMGRAPAKARAGQT